MSSSDEEEVRIILRRRPKRPSPTVLRSQSKSTKLSSHTNRVIQCDLISSSNSSTISPSRDASVAVDYQEADNDSDVNVVGEAAEEMHDTSDEDNEELSHLCAQHADMNVEEAEVVKKSPCGTNVDYCFTAFMKPNLSNVRPQYDKDLMWYLVWQVEKCPKSGKLHMQGFVQFKEKLSYKQATRLMKLGKLKPRLFRRISKSINAATYCKKEDTRATLDDLVQAGYAVDDIKLCSEKGFFQARKPGTDPWKVHYMFKKSLGFSDNQLISKEEFSTVLSTRSGLDLSGQSNKGHRRRVAFTVWGAGGVGKSMVARGIANLVKRFYGWKTYVKDTSKWWQKYRSQELVIVNEMCGAKSGFGWNFFKIFIDTGYLALENKGGSTNSYIRAVLFLSNIDPDTWFVEEFAQHPNDAFGNYLGSLPVKVPYEFTRRMKDTYHLGTRYGRFDTIVSPTKKNMVDPNPVTRKLAGEIRDEQGDMTYEIVVKMGEMVDDSGKAEVYSSDEFEQQILALGAGGQGTGQRQR